MRSITGMRGHRFARLRQFAIDARQPVLEIGRQVGHGTRRPREALACRSATALQQQPDSDHEEHGNGPNGDSDGPLLGATGRHARSVGDAEEDGPQHDGPARHGRGGVVRVRQSGGRLRGGSLRSAAR
jgi:hypothetical protein